MRGKLVCLYLKDEDLSLIEILKKHLKDDIGKFNLSRTDVIRYCLKEVARIKKIPLEAIIMLRE